MTDQPKRLPFSEWMAAAIAEARRETGAEPDADMTWLLGDERDMRAEYDADEAWSQFPEDYVAEQLDAARS